MRIRVTDPRMVGELLEFLTARADAVVEQISDHEVEVSLLGSYSTDAMRMELDLLIRAWEAAHAAHGTVALDA
jgi:hypothetical protein